MLIQSLWLDARFLRIAVLPVADRARFVVGKYVAVLRLLASHESEVTLGGHTFKVASLSTLGTLQSAICDFYDDIVTPGILSAAASPVVAATIIDVGANAGQFSFAAKLFYPDAEVHCFEPDPDTFARLRQNLGNRKGIFLHNLGMGRESASLPFYRHELSLMSSFTPYSDHDYAGREPIILEVSRLDSVTGLPQEVSLLKIDVEGFELAVIDGAEAVLGRSRFLLIEVGLERVPDGGTNLDLLTAIRAIRPAARIMRTGRPLGLRDAPTCEDFLVELG